MAFLFDPRNKELLSDEETIELVEILEEANQLLDKKSKSKDNFEDYFE